jgi:hypothetical protein
MRRNETRSCWPTTSPSSLRHGSKVQNICSPNAHRAQIHQLQSDLTASELERVCLLFLDCFVTVQSSIAALKVELVHDVNRLNRQLAEREQQVGSFLGDFCDVTDPKNDSCIGAEGARGR